MFVGHYGVSFALKSVDHKIPLWVLFIAVQFVDVLWSFFVIVGIEKVRIVPGITASNPLDLYYIPYTHSLIAAIAWSLVSLFIYRVLPKFVGIREALFISLAILSHWFLDLLVHRPDLPIYDNTYKVGFGLWNYPVLAFLLEIGLLLVGIVLYLRSTVATSTLGKYGMVVFGIVMAIAQAVFFFAPPVISSDTGVALIGLFSYVSFTYVVYWLEKNRTNPALTIDAI